MQDVDEARFDELRLGQRRRHAQHRLVGEEDRAFREGIDIASEAQSGEIIERASAESLGPP